MTFDLLIVTLLHPQYLYLLAKFYFPLWDENILELKVVDFIRTPCSSIDEVVRNLRTSNLDAHSRFSMFVRRGNVLADALMQISEFSRATLDVSYMFLFMHAVSYLILDRVYW